MMKSNQYHNYWFTIPILCFAVILGPMGVDLYAPSLPWIAKGLNASPHLTRLTLPCFSYGVAIGSLIFGTLSDAFGRKKPLTIGLALYVVISLLCTASPNVYSLLALRFMQGFFLASLFVGYRAFIADVYGPVNKIQHAMAPIGLFFSLSPIISPFIGAYLQHFLGWEANFVFLAAYGALVLCAFLILPETHWQRTPIHKQQIFKRYLQILTTPVFWVGILFMSVSSIIVIFAVTGSFLIQDILGYSAITFGHTALSLGAACFVGSYVYRFMQSRFKLARIVISNLLAALASAIILAILSIQFPINFWAITIPVFAIFFFISCAGLYQVGTGICISLFPEMAGTAGAASSIIYLLVLSLLVSLASLLKVQTAIPLAIFYLIILITLLVVAIIFSATSSGRAKMG
ncbi:Bcr/CflA family efflux MFS transporter [Piscirickettsia litoralis]|uniref:Bcr/CflA family efflux transporter n=1 Tax=Piscirickettsia litoralis TaxID=1891921 RepID=A0ABX3A3G4_9GAMM|nr:Bcr/CflA family efflux MFS transporter [Piscirickettsia litoralis]ODN43179.1 hypothetical protein BGC07_09945 [Piscirickettsia litoralis]